MQIGVEDLPGAQHGAFARLRLLDLHDHFGAGEYLRSGGDDPGARFLIQRIMRADPVARARFHQHLMTMRGQFMDAFGSQPDAIFVILDFLDGAYDHPLSPAIMLPL